MIGLVRNRFELLRRVGEGGYGVVYEARDKHTSGMVALKLLNAGDEVAEDRFERESAVLAELNHPAIVRYIAHGTAENGRRYLVMEWLKGHTLEAHLARRTSVEDVVSIARRVVAGLSFAELRGVTHRDIKPANLFLVGGLPSGTKILDFGLARRASDRRRLTLTGNIVGTPLYMSPEQARGESAIDHRTDIFSLGTVLYACLSGIDPFDAAMPLATLAKICFDPPVPLARFAPHAPARLCALVDAMMRKPRENRPTWRTIAEELHAVADAMASAPLAGANAHGAGPGCESISQTMEMPRDATGSGSASSLSLRRRAKDGPSSTRIRAAVFVGLSAELSAEREAALSDAASRDGARAERLVDGSLIVLPDAQLAADEQTLVAARCALSLRQLLGGESRLVVCTGRATVDAQQRAGELFERGASMLAAAPQGLVKVDAASAALLSGRFELTDEASTGATLARERSGGEVPRTLMGRPTTFVGRERELSQIQLEFAACTEEPAARAVLVTAPPGAGKSRLRHELVERLRASGARFTLLLGRGDAMRGGTQFGVLANALHAWAELAVSDSTTDKLAKLNARICALVGTERGAHVASFLGEMIGLPFPEHASPQLRAARIDPQLMLDHMLESWLALLGALSQREPLLFCLDDFHWSDPASIRFIDAALRNGPDRALMVLAFARPEIHAAFPALWAERDRLEIRLPKLGARACALFLDAIGGPQLTFELRAAIIERADGNPFFLEELVRRLHANPDGASLPETILAIVQARLDALGEEPKLLIRAASVFGQSFQLIGVRALAGAGDADLDFEGALALLCEREIIVRTGPASEQAYVFRHALIREAAYLLLSDEERALGHRLAATWLEPRGEPPALLAEHYERGEMLSHAARCWARAAGQAFDAGSLDDVTRFGEHAIRCGVEGEELGALSVVLAGARSYGQDDAGAATWAERARRYLPVGEPAWWRATQLAAIASLRLGAPELEALIAQMVANYCDDLASPEQAMAVTYLLSECLRLSRDDLATRLLALLPAELPRALRGRPEGCLAAARAIKAFQAGNLSDALRFAEGALGALRAAGSVRDVCETLALSGHFLHELGAYQEAESRLVEMVAIAERIGSARDVCYGQLYLGAIHARSGRLEEAERVLQTAIAACMRLGVSSFQAEARGHLAGVQLARGALKDARTSLECARLLEGVEPAAAAYLLARSAEVSRREGSAQRALAEAGAAHALLSEHGVQEYVVIVELSYAEALRAVGQTREAQHVLDRASATLLLRAAEIGDAALRSSFLDQVAEHAMLRRLAAAGTGHTNKG
jgi:hypothetical protein